MIPKICYKRIAKKWNALGLAYNDRINDGSKFGTIEIEKRQTPLNILDTEIHELIHMKYPEIPEESVLKMGNYLAKNLWKLGYRAVKKPKIVK
jgi:hypothetical protein